MKSEETTVGPRAPSDDEPSVRKELSFVKNASERSSGREDCKMSSTGLGKRQFYSVMKKNYLLKRRRPFETFLEVFSPLLFCMIIVAFYSVAGTTTNPEMIYTNRLPDIGKLYSIAMDLVEKDSVSTDDAISAFNEVNEILGTEGMRNIPTLDEYVFVHEFLKQNIGLDLMHQAAGLLYLVGGGHWEHLLTLGEIVISPDTPETRLFADWMNKTYYYWHKVQGPFLENLEASESYMKTLKKGEYVWANIHFDKLDLAAKDAEVQIRMKYTSLPDSKATYREFSRGTGTGSNYYYFSGFLTLFRAVELYVSNTTHVLHMEVGSEIDANDLIGHAIGVNDPMGKARTGAGASKAVWENKWIRERIPDMKEISFPQLVDLFKEATGLGPELDSAESIIKTFPVAPRAYSLFDDWGSPFPTLAYDVSSFYDRFGFIAGLILSCAVIFPVSQLILMVVQEKEIRMKEMMKMMGLREWVFNLSWLLTYTVFFFIQSFAMTWYLTATVFGKSSFSLVLLFSFLFNQSLIALAFMISTVFNRAKLASMVGPLVIFAMVIPAYIFTFYASFEFVPVKKFLSLLSPTAYAFGIERIIALERNMVGLTWENMGTGSVPFTYTLGMLVFDFLLYATLAWYLDQVIPTKYGTHQKWTFIFKPHFWSKLCSSWYKRICRRHKSSDEQLSATIGENNFIAPSIRSSKMGCIEAQLENVDFWDTSQPALEIKDLKKIYRQNGKVAVNGINIDMMHNEVTCLLGTNGAGKSSTMAMLTGLYEVTSGDAYIYGESIVRDITNSRRIMGVCPQHNVLYPDLTVSEHLFFFASLKGMKASYIGDEVAQLVENLELTSKMHAKSKTLSGGQKRKLSLGIALIADSRMIFLDEPTAGMDLQARRAMWDLILASKKGRTIVLTTHFLEEADLLGDKICVMKDGNVIASGNSLELKLQYGLGYVITMTKKDHAESDVDALTEFITQNVPDSQLLTNCAGEVSYQLPSSQNKALINLFSKIEKKFQEFNILNYGVSMSSLEEVFLRIAEGDEKKAENSLLTDYRALKSGQNVSNSWEAELGEISFGAQFWQVFKKRYTSLRRDRGSIFNELVLPLLVVTSTLFVLSVNPSASGPPLVLTTASLMPDFNKVTPVNRDSWLPDDAVFPGAFDFQPFDGSTYPTGEIDPNARNRVVSPYFPGDTLLYLHNCETTTCLSHRYLADRNNRSKAASAVMEIDQQLKRLELCAFQFGDIVSLPMNFSSFLGIDNSTREEVLLYYGQLFGVSREDAMHMQMDELVDHRLNTILEQDLRAPMIDLTTPNTSVSLSTLLEKLQADTMPENSGSSIARRVNNWIGKLLTGLSTSESFANVFIKRVSGGGSSGEQNTESDSTEGIAIGIVEASLWDGVLKLKDLLLVGGDTGTKRLWEIMYPEDAKNTTTSLVDQLFNDLQAEYDRDPNRTETILGNRTLDEVSLSDILEILRSNRTTELYTEQACRSNVTWEELETSYGENFVNKYGNETEKSICQAVKDRGVYLAYLVAFWELHGPGDYHNHTEKGDDETGGDSETPPSRFTMADLFPTLRGTSFTVFDLITKGATKTWVNVPGTKINGGGDRVTLAMAFAAINVDIAAEVTAAFNKVPILSMVAPITLGTIMGTDILNISIPVASATLFNTASDHSKIACMVDIANAKIRAKARSEGRYTSGNDHVKLKVWVNPFEAGDEANLFQMVWLAFFAVLFTLVPFCYNPACYGMHAVQERVSSCKHLLLVSGLGYKTYWLSNLAFDFCCYMIVASWTMFCFTASGAIRFDDSTRSAIAFGTIVLFILYGLAAIPQAYALSFIFSNDASAQICISLFNFFTGWMFVVTSISLDIYNLKEEAEIMRKFFRMFPAFNLGEGLIAATKESITLNILGSNDNLDPFQWEVMGRNLVIMCILIVSYTLILVMIEYSMGNVHLNKSLQKVRRIFTKLRGWKSRQAMIMPVHRNKSKPDSPEKPTSMDEPVYEFSDDEDEDAPPVSKIYSDGPNKKQVGDLIEEDLEEDHMTEKIMSGQKSFKNLEGGVLRCVDQGSSTGFEFQPKGSSKRSKTNMFVFDEDTDVRAERRRVLRGSLNGRTDILEIKSVRKVYTGILAARKVVAVRKLTLGIPRGECFGFLGTNGAGKTTTMKMITKNIFPSEGKILLDGKSIFSYSSSREIGYCPQFDALFPRLTAREHLRIYASIKGVHKNEVETLVENLLKQCDLVPFADVWSSTYSGGTKRKLSIAIALIGKPKLILLDEPSAGVDPYARRKIWEIICGSLNNERSMVLTSHSMEECEALCGRIGIMTSGVLRCVGSSLHLKEKFCSGYEVVIRTGTKQECFLAVGYLQTIMGATVKELFGTQAKLSVPCASLTLAGLFKVLETNRKLWNVVSYGVSQASLDQVFMNIATKHNPQTRSKPSLLKQPSKQNITEPKETSIEDALS